MKRTVALALVLAAVVGVLVGPGHAIPPIAPRYTVVGDGGITNYYNDGHYDLLGWYLPPDRCSAVLPGGSQAVACSGWSYWNRNRVWKAGGGWIRVGFWRITSDGYPVFDAWNFDSSWNGRAAVVDRTDVNAPPYNVVGCAYDFEHGRDWSNVLCEVIDW
jgi:hypothetical protein